MARSGFVASLRIDVEFCTDIYEYVPGSSARLLHCFAAPPANPVRQLRPHFIFDVCRRLLA
jgi:hypothetical protein